MCYTFELKFFFPLFWPNLEIVTDRYHLYDSRANTYVCKLNIFINLKNFVLKF